MIQCRYEEGKKANLRHATVDSIIVKNNQILLIKRSSHYHIEPGKLALPGGFLERDETADQGARREVLEETGFVVNESQLFSIVHAPRLKGDNRQNIAFVYISAVGEQISKFDSEVESLQWYPLNKLPAASLWGFDHLDFVTLYKHHRRQPQPLPYINFNLL